MLFRILIICGCFAVSYPAQSQDKIPSLVKSNSLLAGQIYGCVQRLGLYARFSSEASKEDSPEKNISENLNKLVGLDVDALKIDITAIISGDKSNKIEVTSDLIEIMAKLEFTGSSNLAWAQVAGCSSMFHNLGLYEAYSLK